jgi:predicted RNA-binding Zn-ribbon protein involved in translation (DUF1610 family)
VCPSLRGVVVAHHNRRGREATAGAPVCLDCGTRYLLTNTYKGNYCPDCHETWIDRQRDDVSPSPTPPRLRPSEQRSSDDDSPTEPYDEE